jgi:hypothetical protein
VLEIVSGWYLWTSYELVRTYTGMSVGGDGVIGATVIFRPGPISLVRRPCCSPT